MLHRLPTLRSRQSFSTRQRIRGCEEKGKIRTNTKDTESVFGRFSPLHCRPVFLLSSPPSTQIPIVPPYAHPLSTLGSPSAWYTSMSSARRIGERTVLAADRLIPGCVSLVIIPKAVKGGILIFFFRGNSPTTLETVIPEMSSTSPSKSPQAVVESGKPSSLLTKN